MALMTLFMLRVIVRVAGRRRTGVAGGGSDRGKD